MSGFELFDGDTEMRIINGARTVLTTEGTLINLLPPSYDINSTFNIDFPNFSLDYWYSWVHTFSYTALGDMVGYDSSCSTYLTVPKQDFTNEINLLTAPADADIFVGRITLARTINPSHTWNAQTIQPLQPTGQSIPFISGSLLMEAAYGMARACSIYVSGGFLKLHRQQSVSEPPGGWGFFGTTFDWVAKNSGGGGENVNGGSRGIPILQVDLNNVPSITGNAGPLSPRYDERTRRGGPNACTLPVLSNYNYSSRYSATLTGSFGRRS